MVKNGSEIHSESDPNGAVDPSIDSVLAFDGANGHTSPNIDITDQNAGDHDGVIETIHDKDGLYIKTPDHDVAVKSDPANHMEWYGVQKDGKTEWFDSKQAVAIRKE